MPSGTAPTLAGMELTDQDLQERAAYRRERSAYGIGVAVGRDITERDRYRAKRYDAVFCGRDGFARQEIFVRGVHEAADLDRTLIEATVERHSGRFPIETRLRDLTAESVTVKLDRD
jgi:hypothetical protein